MATRRKTTAPGGDHDHRDSQGTARRRQRAQRVSGLAASNHGSPETMGGEPVFKGTRISVAHVGALASRGRPLQEILEDYPRLSEDDVRLAEIVFKMGPRPGRPRKPLKLKR